MNLSKFIKKEFAHFFIPHRHTHQKAHLLSTTALLIYIAFFILLQFSFSAINKFQPGVLGISSDVDVKELIRLTNEERKKKGLHELTENEQLAKAAHQKGLNMFEENYWAHFAPSGKSPWDFIKAQGYSYQYAGENLARNFYTSEDAVKAWMNSPTHRDNILSDKYGEIGMAVLEGTLNGQKTILIVQEFGATPEYVASRSLAPPEQQAAVPTAQPLLAEQPTSLANVASSVSKNQPVTISVTVDPFQIYKTAGISLLVFLVILLAIDFMIIKQRGVVSLAHRHWSHMALMGLAATNLFQSSPGSII